MNGEDERDDEDGGEVAKLRKAGCPMLRKDVEDVGCGQVEKDVRCPKGACAWAAAVHVETERDGDGEVCKVPMPTGEGNRVM